MDEGEGKSLVGEMERARSGRERATQKRSASQQQPIRQTTSTRLSTSRIEKVKDKWKGGD